MKRTEKIDLKQIQWITLVCMAAVLLLAISAVIAGDPSQVPLTSIVNIVCGVAVMIGYCVLLLACAMDRGVPDRSALLFHGLLVIGFLGVLTDNFGWILNGKPDLIWANHITAVLSFLLTAAVGPGFLDYQNALFPGDRPEHHKPLWGFMAADAAYIITASMTGFLYTIDAGGNYASNAGTYFAGIYPYFVLLLCMAKNLRRKIPTRQRIALLAFNVTPLLAGIVTLFFADSSIIFVALFFDLMLMYGVVQMERSIEMAEQKAELAEQSEMLAVQRHIMAEQSRDLAEKQTQIMLSQIQPHFIYNTLGSISSLCMDDPKLAADVTDQFARYLRGNMASIKHDHLVPFEKELEHTKTYLWIEQIRFADYLHIAYHITCTDFYIPPLTLQPLVENAVKHGITPKEEGGTVTIDTHETPDHFVITVSDDGVGYEPDAPAGDGKYHVGLENVRTRLEILCKGKLEIKSRAGTGTVVTVAIPKEEHHESFADR